MIRSLAVSLVVVAALMAGCSSNSAVHGIFGPNGGTLSDNGATLTIPPGALASETTITLTPSPGTAAPTGALQVGTPQLLEPEGLMFAVPVTLEMSIDASRLGGQPARAVVVYTTPASLVAYTTLPTRVVDAKDVSAPTTHFSIFQPAIPVLSSETTGGSSGSSSAGSSGTSGGTTSGGSSGEPATATGGNGSTGTASGGATSGGTTTGGTTTGGEVLDAGGDAGPDAGEEMDAGPDGGEANDAGPADAGETDAGGAATCSSNTDCIGALGCMAIAIDSKSNGGASCNNPFLAPSDVQSGIANGGFIHPGTTPALPSIDTTLDSWSIEIDLPCCPASTGTLAVSAVVNWNGGGVNCDGDPKGTGTIDFTELDDGGLAGTFTTTVLNGMSGSFSFPSTLNGGFCDAGQPDLPPTPVDIEDAGADAGTTDCAADLACLGPDAGGLSGTGGFWLNPTAAAGGTWCKGPVEDLSSTASIGNVWDPTAEASVPTVSVVYDSDFFELQAALPCCPAGPGTLAATSINLLSNVCGVSPNVPSPMVSAGTGSVTFTQTDGGLVGSIHLDGTTEADATFSIP